MKPIVRKSAVRWTGGANNGSGAMTTASGKLMQSRYFMGTPFKQCATMSYPRGADGSIKIEMETLPLQSFEENAFEVRVALKPKMGATRDSNGS